MSEKLTSFIKSMNTEDWWSAYCGLGIFAISCLLSTLPIPTDLNLAPQWNTNPFSSHDHWYYWLLVIPVVLFLICSSMLSIHFINKTKKYEDKKNPTVVGLIFVSTIAFLSILIGNQQSLKSNGIGSAMWSIFFGLLFSNVIFRGYHLWKTHGYEELRLDTESQLTRKSKWVEPCIPEWLKDCVLDEFFIKISLVLLAMDLMAAKDTIVPSMLVAWIDTPILVMIIYFIGVKLFKIEDDYSLIMAAAVSVCGSSAANAVGTTIGATKDQMNYPIAIMSFFTVPMIPLMPIFFEHVFQESFGWTEEQGGGWIGGSVDSTGAVIASASMLGEDAKSSAAIVKMLQNCLIGPICLIIIIARQYSSSKDPEETPINAGIPPKKIGIVSMLWERFPKFVLGFFLVCGLLTAATDSDWKTRTISTCLAFSSWFETIGFVCIGLNIQIGEMISKMGVLKLIPLYVTGQLLDCVTTAIAAYYALQKSSL